MGATTFEQVGKGKTVKLAFEAAREQALWEYGHRGYTGSLAEKDGYIVVVPPKGVTAEQVRIAIYRAHSEDGVNYPDRPDWAPDASVWDSLVQAYNDKWGPCLAIDAGDDEWLFCGWASC